MVTRHAIRAAAAARALLLLVTWACGGSPIHVDEAALRANASEYPTPEYPVAAIRAGHAGRVVVQVVVFPVSARSPYARVRSSNVLEAPDRDLATAVLAALEQTRYMPFFDDRDRLVEATGRVAWEFRLVDGTPQVIDPHAAAETALQAASDDLRIVQRASAILHSEATWNRTDNRQCPPHARTFSLYCAVEKATQEVTGRFQHRGAVMEDARAAIEEVAPHRNYDHRLMDYNNDPSTTFADVQRVLQLTETRVATRLQR